MLRSISTALPYADIESERIYQSVSSDFDDNEIVLHDRLSLDVRERAKQLAASAATVLIHGETGTGKERLARLVHKFSGRRGDFVAVNCGALSEALADAELFGHEVGAFTGAQRSRPGWFEAANGGTLFLDEIGELTLPLQVKLLRVLQERQVVRLGARRPIPLDIRIVAATNVDLDEAVRLGKFRLDLFYRINVASLRLSPLRDRPDDILQLAGHFLQDYCRQLGRSQLRLTASAESALLAHPWPGNIRELENALHAAAILATGETIDIGDLHLKASGRDIPREGASLSPLMELQSGIRRLLASDHEAVHELVDGELLKVAFEFCEYNQVRTAKRLGISRNILRFGLKRFGLISQGEAL